MAAGAAIRRFVCFWPPAGIRGRIYLTGSIVCIKLYKYEKYDKREGGICVPAGKHLLGMRRGGCIFGTAKVGEKGQIVIPKEARTMFHIQPGDTLLLLGDEDSGIIVTKPEELRDIAARILGNLDRKKEEEHEP